MHADDVRRRRRHWSGRYGSRKEGQIIERRFGEMDVEEGECRCRIGWELNWRALFVDTRSAGLEVALVLAR